MKEPKIDPVTGLILPTRKRRSSFKAYRRGRVIMVRKRPKDPNAPQKPRKRKRVPLPKITPPKQARKGSNQTTIFFSDEVWESLQFVKRRSRLVDAAVKHYMRYLYEKHGREYHEWPK